MKHIRINLIIILSSIVLSAQAQEAITVIGGDDIGSGGSVAYSVGQIAYRTSTNVSTGSVTEGVQQTYEIFTLGVNNKLNTSLSAYPNPTTHVLNLQIENYYDQKLSYQLFDIQGRQLSDAKITTQKTQINTSILPAGTYFINVLDQNKKIQSFKFIKN